MLTLKTVAMTDGFTSLHSPLFVVGLMATSFVVAGDEHEVAKRVRPAPTGRDEESGEEAGLHGRQTTPVGLLPSADVARTATRWVRHVEQIPESGVRHHLIST